MNKDIHANESYVRVTRGVIPDRCGGMTLSLARAPNTHPPLPSQLLRMVMLLTSFSHIHEEQNRQRAA